MGASGKRPPPQARGKVAREAFSRGTLARQRRQQATKDLFRSAKSGHFVLDAWGAVAARWSAARRQLQHMVALARQGRYRELWSYVRDPLRDGAVLLVSESREKHSLVSVSLPSPDDPEDALQIRDQEVTTVTQV